METRKRSLVKSVVWRALGLVELAFETYILASHIKDPFLLAIVIPVTHMIVRFIEYYFHERLWSRIKWGYK